MRLIHAGDPDRVTVRVGRLTTESCMRALAALGGSGRLPLGHIDSSPPAHSIETLVNLA